MSTRVRLPDGNYVTVPTTDRAEAAAAARRYWQNQQRQNPTRSASRPTGGSAAARAGVQALARRGVETRPRQETPRRSTAPSAPPRTRRRGQDKSTFGLAGDFIDNVTDNALPNFGDEIAGFGGGLGYLLTGRDYMDGYDRESQAFLRRQERYKRENPTLHAASAVTGTGLGMALPAGRVGQNASLWQRSKQAAGVGAAYGGLAGFGDGEGIVERGGNAITGSLVGGAFGSLIPGGTQLAQNGGRWARRNIPGVDAAVRGITDLPSRAIAAFQGREFTPSVREAGVEMADRMIGDRMRQGNIASGFGQQGPRSSPQAIAEEVARRNARGVPAMIGDTTESMRGLTEYAGRGLGPGQQLVRRAIESRKSGEGQRIRQHVQETFPTTDDPIKYVEDATRRARQEAAPLYQDAYSQPVFRTPEIQGIEQTPAFRDALPQAYRNIRNQIDEATGLPKDPNAMGFRQMDVDPNGLPPNGPYFQTPDGRFISYEEGLSMEGYDQVARAMRDQGKAASNINPVTGRVESTTNSVHINNLAGDLRKRLGAQNPSYREATSRYADEMGMNSAFRQGEDIGNLTGPEVQAILRANPQGNARDAFTRGAGTSLANEASRYSARYPNGDTAARIRQMIGDAPKQDALSTAQGNTGGVRDLLERLEFEEQGNQVYKRVNGNSATAQRQQLDADIDGGLGLPTSMPDAARRIISVLADRATPQLQQEVKNRIAQVVTASDAKTVNEVMAAIANQAERDAAFRQLLQRANVSLAALYGMNIETN